MSREQVRVGTPIYNEKMRQHAEFVALKAVHVPMTEQDWADAESWSKELRRHNNSNVDRTPYHQDGNYEKKNVLGYGAVIAVHRVIGGTIVCKPDGRSDLGWDIELNGRRFDVKWRQEFLTPTKTLRDVNGCLEESILLASGVELILVNPFPETRRGDLFVCGVIDRQSFLAAAFDFYMPTPCLAVTAQPLRRVETIS